MKQRDLTVIITVAVIAGILSFVVSNLIFGGPKAYQLTAPKVDPISSDFTSPSTKYFSSQSIDPTVDITIGESANPDPIKQTQ